MRRDSKTMQAMPRLEASAQGEAVTNAQAVKNVNDESGKIRTGILLWLIGIPLPVILLFYLFKGCV